MTRPLEECIAEAVHEAAAEPEYDTAEAALRWLLECAWHDLHQARRVATGHWSLECDRAVHTIVGLTRLVGPVERDKVQNDLVADGVYERIHEAMKVRHI